MPPTLRSSDKVEPNFWEEEDTQEPPQLGGLRKTAAYFGFQTISELQDFWQSPLWKPYADSILENVIQPERARAIARSTTRVRSCNFATVEALIKEGESSGRGRYSYPHTDKSTFNQTDYYCHALYQLKYWNSTMFGGLFFGKAKISDHWKLCLLWAMLQTWFYEHTPSRVKKREEAAKKRAAKEVAQAAKTKRNKNSKTTQQPLSTTPGSGQPSTIGGLSTEDDDLLPTPNSDSVNVPSDHEDEIEVTDTTDTSDPGMVETSRVFPTDVHAPLDETTQREVEERLAASNNELNLKVVVHRAKPQMLTSIQRMYLERVYGDDNDRAHRYDLLQAVQKGYQEPRLIASQVEALANRNRIIDEQDWQRQLRRVSEADDLIDADPVLPFDLANDDTRQEFINTQSLLDDLASQPQGHQLACARMGLVRYDRPRYKSMPLSASFKFWQVLAFDWIHRQKASGLNGVLLCDSMGLGKTWEIVGYMLSSIHLRREALAKGADVGPPRPFLVVVPPGILPNQWATQIADITDELTIVKYWGELTNIKDSSRKKILRQDDVIFTKNEKNASIVVITTFQTMRSRHGPLAQEAFHVNTKKWSEERAAREFQLLDKTWPHGLKGRFSDVIADEATFVKNIGSQSHITLKWLDSFTILVTATPDINSVNDFEAYMNFIQPSDDVLNKQVYLTFTPGPAFNPYTQEALNALQGTLLRCTLQYFKRFVLDSNNPIQQGSYLSKLYGDCMIRRSHVSRVDGKMIGDDIPALKVRRCECEWVASWDETNTIDTGREFKKYESLSKEHKRLLVHIDDFGNVTWNWGHYRCLVLLSTWTGFAHVEAKMQAEHVTELIKLDKNLLDWIVKGYCKATNEHFPEDVAGRLAIVCDGGPKIRALLHILATVVVLMKKKLLIFCTLPAEQLLVFAICRAVNISAKVYHSNLDRSEKVDLQYAFNNNEDPQVLIGTFATASVGINLHEMCHWIMFLDPPSSNAVGQQAMGRCHRVGQTDVVEVVMLTTKRSFNDRQNDSNFKKAIPGVVAALNKEAFMGAQLQVDGSGKARLSLGDWVMHNGQLKRIDDQTLPLRHNLRVMQGNEVVHAVVDLMMGEKITWDEPQETPAE